MYHVDASQHGKYNLWARRNETLKFFKCFIIQKIVRWFVRIKKIAFVMICMWIN